MTRIIYIFTLQIVNKNVLPATGCVLSESALYPQAILPWVGLSPYQYQSIIMTEMIFKILYADMNCRAHR